MKRHVLGLLITLLPTVVVAQTNPAAQAARQWRQQQERAIVDEFVALLRIPNVAQDRENIQRNAGFITEMMQKRGISARLVSVPGANPVVFGEIGTPGALRAIVFYAHYDGQPVDPKQWATAPFTPTLRSEAIERGGQVVAFPQAGRSFDPESRLYARSAGDDKTPIIAKMVALDAFRAAAIKAKSNLKFVFEGEEEAGSPNLERILSENKALFAGDLWLICDSPTNPSRRQQIVFGAPGLARVDITVFGAAFELQYRETVARIAEHVRAQGFFVVDADPSIDLRMAHEEVAMVTMRGGGYNATRTPMDLPIAQEVIGTVESARGPVVKLPTMGGAVPLEVIERTLGTRTIVMPIANHDNNQHGFDENLRIQNLWDGIELMAAMLTM